MYEIKTYNEISKKGLLTLTPEKYHITSNEENPDAIIVRSYKIQPDEFGNNLKCIARAGAGYNNIPVERCTEKGIVVFNTPGANANAVKELVIAGLLLSSRRITESISALKELPKNEEIAKEAEKIKKKYAGPEIANKTLGVYGLGAIGVLVAQAAIALGMKVIGYDPHISIKNALNIPKELKLVEQQDEILGESDYITFHIPAITPTIKMVNSKLISKMKPGVRLINFARAEIVDIPDIKEALDKNIISYYVCDFADSILVNQKNAIVFPHIGASTPEAEENCAVMSCNQVSEYLETGNIENSVNIPSLQMPWINHKRLAIIHKSVPGMLADISKHLGKASINIINTLSRTGNNIAYTLMDIDKNVDDQFLEQIFQMNNVIKVRLI